MRSTNLNFLEKGSLALLRIAMDQRHPFIPDSSIPMESPTDYALWEMKQMDRVRSEVDRRLRSLPLKQYLKEKKRFDAYLK